MASKSDNYTNVLLEDMNSKIQAVLEIVTTTMATKQDIASLKEELAEVKSDLKVVKAVVTHQSDTLNDHDSRIIRLEHKIA